MVRDYAGYIGSTLVGTVEKAEGDVLPTYLVVWSDGRKSLGVKNVYRKLTEEEVVAFKMLEGGNG